METKFQTSFIPKKAAPMPGIPNLAGAVRQQHVKRGATSILYSVGIMIFLVSLLGAGGVFAWKKMLITQQASYREQLKVREEQFNIPLIEQLKMASARINLARRLLESHVAVSNVFDVVSRFTVESVRFLNMELSTSGESREYRVSLRGYGTSLPTVAFQSDVLGQLEQYNLRKVLRNPIISEPVIDKEGTVSFSINASVEPETFSYVKQVTGSVSLDAEPPSADAGTQSGGIPVDQNMPLPPSAQPSGQSGQPAQQPDPFAPPFQ